LADMPGGSSASPAATHARPVGCCPATHATPCLDDTLVFYFDESDSNGGLRTPLPENDDAEQFSFDPLFEAKPSSRASSPAGSAYSAPSSYTAQTTLLADGSLIEDSSLSPWPSPDEMQHDVAATIASGAIAIQGRSPSKTEQAARPQDLLHWTGSELASRRYELASRHNIALVEASSSCPADFFFDDVLPRMGPYASCTSRDGRNPRSLRAMRLKPDQIGAKSRRKRRSQLCTELEQQLATLHLDLGRSCTSSLDGSLHSSCNPSLNPSLDPSRSSSPLPMFDYVGPSSLPSYQSPSSFLSSDDTDKMCV